MFFLCSPRQNAKIVFYFWQDAYQALRGGLIHVDVQITKMKDYKSIERRGDVGQSDVVVPNFDIGGVSATAPV